MEQLRQVLKIDGPLSPAPTPGLTHPVSQTPLLSACQRAEGDQGRGEDVITVIVPKRKRVGRCVYQDTELLEGCVHALFWNKLFLSMHYVNSSILGINEKQKSMPGPCS